MERILTRWTVPERVGKPLVAVALSLAAIAAAPLVMGPSYALLQPRLGALTLIVVEVLYALFIDFPLAAAYVAVVSLWFGRRRNPARCAVGFVVVFFVLILLCIAVAPTSELLAYWELADTFPVATAALVAEVGVPTVALLVVAFLVFDLLFCATAGVTADILVGGQRHSAANLGPTDLECVGTVSDQGVRGRSGERGSGIVGHRGPAGWLIGPDQVGQKLKLSMFSALNLYGSPSRTVASAPTVNSPSLPAANVSPSAPVMVPSTSACTA